MGVQPVYVLNIPLFFGKSIVLSKNFAFLSNFFLNSVTELSRKISLYSQSAFDFPQNQPYFGIF